MKIWAVALNTLNGFLRNRILILFALLFAGMLLLMLSPILMMKALKTADASQAQTMILGLITGAMTFATAFGSFLSIWAAADAVSREMRSGTILAVMARPIRRWEYLLGKYLGVQMLMALYVVLMLLLSYLLAWIAGEMIYASPLALALYPMARYAIYSALALFLVTFLPPFAAVGVAILFGVFAHIATGEGGGLRFLPHWMSAAIAYVLPSTNLLSEVKFLTLTRASLKPAPIAEHLTVLAYGLDYAVILFLLAVWAFRKRRLAGI